MINTKLIFVEGIMGAGKSTTARYLTTQLQQQHLPGSLLREGGADNPVRVARSLPHRFAVWLDVTPDQFIELSLQKWQAYVRAAQQPEIITVSDGLLFHGNMTDLLLLNVTPQVLHDYVFRVLTTLRELKPILIYFHQASVADALRLVCDERGSDWEAYQVNWKLASPYAQQRNLQGFDGLVQLYQVYCAICDEIFAQLMIPKIAIDNTVRNYGNHYRTILNFLELTPESSK